MNLGKAIKLCRIQRGLSQTDLAKIASISVSYLSLLERGKRDPTFSTVKDISIALDIPLVILIFLAATDVEMSEIAFEVREKLSFVAITMLKD